MGWPRPRYTIARLMILILLVGLTTWVMQEVRKRLVPTIAESQAQANYQQARLVREVAEYAYKEYEIGVFQQDRDTINGQIKIAESDLDRAKDRLQWSFDMMEMEAASKSFNPADLLAKQRAEFDLAQAKTQLEVLEKYTRDKQLKSLVSDIEKAKADEQAKFQAWQRERSRRLWWGNRN